MEARKTKMRAIRPQTLRQTAHSVRSQRQRLQLLLTKNTKMTTKATKQTQFKLTMSSYLVAIFRQTHMHPLEGAWGAMLRTSILEPELLCQWLKKAKIRTMEISQPQRVKEKINLHAVEEVVPASFSEKTLLNSFIKHLLF